MRPGTSPRWWQSPRSSSGSRMYMRTASPRALPKTSIFHSPTCGASPGVRDRSWRRRLPPVAALLLGAVGLMSTRTAVWVAFGLGLALLVVAGDRLRPRRASGSRRDTCGGHREPVPRCRAGRLQAARVLLTAFRNGSTDEGPHYSRQAGSFSFSLQIPRYTVSGSTTRDGASLSLVGVRLHGRQPLPAALARLQRGDLKRSLIGILQGNQGVVVCSHRSAAQLRNGRRSPGIASRGLGLRLVGRFVSAGGCSEEDQREETHGEHDGTAWHGSATLIG